MNWPPSHCPIGSRVRCGQEDGQEDCMERTDYISTSPHMPDCVTAKSHRDCGVREGGGHVVEAEEIGEN